MRYLASWLSYWGRGSEKGRQEGGNVTVDSTGVRILLARARVLEEQLSEARRAAHYWQQEAELLGFSQLEAPKQSNQAALPPTPCDEYESGGKQPTRCKR